MAKNNGKLKVASLVIALAVLFSGIVGTWAIYGKSIEDNAEDLNKLETDGCKPTIVLEKELALTKKDVVTVQKDIVTVQENYEELKVEQQAMRIEQSDGFKEILRRLPK